MSLHDEIMNIQTSKAANEKIDSQVMAYKRGHRDARHAAAELAIAQELEMERMKEVLRDAYTLAIGHAAAYKFNHELDDIHPLHAEILKKCQQMLGFVPN